MKFFHYLLLLTAGYVIADGQNGHQDNDDDEQDDGPRSTNVTLLSTSSKCNRLSSLAILTAEATNTTFLDAKFEGNATQVAAFQAKASAAATTLTELQSNTTLVTVCGEIAAVRTMSKTCSRMTSLEKVQAQAANTTFLDAKFKGNATKIALFQASASAQAPALAILQSNTTLTAFCTAEDTKEQCQTMSELERQLNQAANATFVDAKFKGNSDKIAKFQAQAAKAQVKLTEMQSNLTLAATCASLSKCPVS
ncbi:hypothetical protein GQ53DRAFT_84018 [Thozetella sp. PMI_491]|nr:hypothetical protein GQ53DRAFT_84018 [Thozetella sp. PMI_491]